MKEEFNSTIEEMTQDRKSVVQGKSVDLGGRRIIKKKKKEKQEKREEQKEKQ